MRTQPGVLLYTSFVSVRHGFGHPSADALVATMDMTTPAKRALICLRIRGILCRLKKIYGHELISASAISAPTMDSRITHCHAMVLTYC